MVLRIAFTEDTPLYRLGKMYLGNRELATVVECVGNQNVPRGTFYITTIYDYTYKCRCIKVHFMDDSITMRLLPPKRYRNQPFAICIYPLQFDAFALTANTYYEALCDLIHKQYQQGADVKVIIYNQQGKE